jgi:hypothetical protein
MKFRDSALGITVGDIVTTSYKTGPYRVTQIIGPCYWSGGEWTPLLIFDTPHISLVLEDLRDGMYRTDSYISDIRVVGNRWFTSMNDEIFVEPVLPAPEFAGTLFALFDELVDVNPLPIPAPYKLQEGVDYEVCLRQVWHCGTCGRDFNGNPVNQYAGASCVFGCRGALAVEVYMIKSPKDLSVPYLSYQSMTTNKVPYMPSVTYQEYSSRKLKAA